MGNTRDIWRAGVAGAVVAAAVNLVIFTIGRLADVDFTLVLNGSTSQVGAATVLLLSFGSVLAGTVLAALLARGGAHRLRWAQLAGAAIAVLTAVGPLSITGGTASGVLLASMHLVTGAVYVLALQLARLRSTTTARPVVTASR